MIFITITLINKVKIKNCIKLVLQQLVLLDLKATPFDPIYPGVEVHTNVIDNILKVILFIKHLGVMEQILQY